MSKTAFFDRIRIWNPSKNAIDGRIACCSASKNAFFDRIRIWNPSKNAIDG